jgi:DNA (cytosine-5)-methyltransferase 1
MRAVELFAGAGGLGLGVSRAGFKPEAVIEWDRYCADTLRENQFFGHDLVRDWPVHQMDVRQFDFATVLAGLDLVTGGPPCQPFSIGGKHKGPLDARDMWPQAVRAIRETAPRAFIFENVKGLTRASFANYFAYIQLQLRYPELGASSGEDWQDHLQRLERYHTLGKERGLYYRLVARVLNAADYGVPQKRERVVIVGFRSDLNIEWSFPPPTHSLDALIWSQYRDGDYWERHGVSRRDRPEVARLQSRAKRMDEKPALRPWLTVRDAISDLPDPQSAAAAAVPNHRFQGGARAYPGHTGSPIDEAAKTLKAGDHGVPGGENMLALPDGRVRYFTVRESARLQTFPDDFAFHGSWTETMRQLGNAVPVTLACAIATSVRQQLAAVDSCDGLQPARQEESGAQRRRGAAFH